MADLINPIKEAWNVMLHPSRANTATGPSFYYRAVVIPGIINAIIAALLITAFPSATSFFGSSGPLFGFIMFLLLMFIGIPASIVIDSALVHLFGKLLFRIMKQPFNNTLTAMSYAISPFIFFYWTEALPSPVNSIASIILAIWVFILMIFLLSKTQRISKLRALGALLIPVIIIGIIIVVIMGAALLTLFLGTSFVIPSNTNVSVTTTVRPSLTTTVRPSNANVSVTTTPSLVDTIPIAINGNGTPTGIAITPNGDYAYVANAGNATVSVISTSTNKVVKTIPVDVNGTPTGIAITPNGDYAYVTNFGSGTVSVINTSTNKVETIPIGFDSFPYEIAITPNGNYAYVTDSSNGINGTVSVISTSTNKVVKTIPIAINDTPVGIAITPNGDYAYVVNNDSVSVIRT